jgi:tubulin delta
MSSLAGGTGSGLGSCLIEAVADAHPELYRFNMCVVPHLSGEVILQSYNCALTIAALYEHSDGIMLIENDTVHDICNRLLNLKRPSLAEMNAVIAH